MKERKIDFVHQITASLCKGESYKTPKTFASSLLKCQLTFLPYTFRQGREQTLEQPTKEQMFTFFTMLMVHDAQQPYHYLPFFTKVQNRVVHGSIAKLLKEMGGIFQLPYRLQIFPGWQFHPMFKAEARLFAYSVRNTNELFVQEWLKTSPKSPILSE